jgi:DNA-binding NtrC family response regulator
MSPLRILILDDEENIRKSLGLFLKMHDYEVDTAAVPSEARKKLRESEFQVLITDVRMPEMDGIQLTEELKLKFPELTILVVTAYGNVRDAVQALRKGAFDYLTKPLDHEELLIILQRIGEQYRLIRELQSLRRRLKTESPYRDLVGSSEAIRGIYALIDRAARSDYSVLITGETGTGKEIVARAIHHNSTRKNGALVPVNCGALAETMMESELFGHLKGSFTGAVKDRQGKIRTAQGGTLFLDEVGLLSPAAQMKLLRVLDERTFEPLGSDKTITADIRIVAATNEDLSQAVKDGKFREDLYYRLDVIHIAIPPLRKHKEDIPVLVRHVFKKLGREDLKISSGAMNLLLGYDWPGNIRELENVLKSTMALIDGDTIVLEHFPTHLRAAGGGINPDFSHLDSFQDKVALFEKCLIEEKFRQTGGNVTRAAQELDFPLRSLRRKMEKYSIKSSLFKARTPK